MNQPVLIVDLDGSSSQQPHSILPGDHVLALVVDIAGEGHILAYLDLEMFPLGVEGGLGPLLVVVVGAVHQVGVHILRGRHTYEEKKIFWSEWVGNI